MLRYHGKLSGPLLDRIDIQIAVPSLRHEELMSQSRGECSDVIRQRVELAHGRQLERQGKSNGQLAGGEIEIHCSTDAAGQALLKQAITRLNLSARGYHRVLKLARTIADMQGVVPISSQHIAEAIQYRRLTKADNV